MIVKQVKDVIKEIKKMRKEMGMTNEQIAFYGDMSKGTISKILNGKSKQFSLQTLLKIAKAFDRKLEISFRK